ncbi:hypothetical protein D8674_017731 [Pyrus ussuriensis x Pyrus communis]|uniref:Uncharacterized protein n=1 Tax=Pyrus ussuriensis x Pyrus communis TaxID=2448454 RepID=A0A5N5HIP8_9ROSA|nr:hypothetical protein D8674_017731 [Pyrus ussuriensis x Pyrus communis]
MASKKGQVVPTIKAKSARTITIQQATSKLVPLKEQGERQSSRECSLLQASDANLSTGSSHGLPTDHCHEGTAVTPSMIAGDSYHVIMQVMITSATLIEE